MARLGPGVACVCSSGGRQSAGAWGGAPLGGGWPDCQVLDNLELYGVVAFPPRAGRRGVGPRV